jgi:hypothetical protein
MLRSVLTAAALAASLSIAGPAAAAIITNPDNSTTISSGTAAGSSFTLNFNGVESGSVIPGLTSNLTLTFQGVSGSSYLFDYLLNNTSSAPVTSSTVTGFGFDVDPNANQGTSSVTGTFGVVGSGAIASNSLEICFKNGQTNNCSGSPGNTGVGFGSSGSGSVSLGFDSLPGSITLSNALVRYQAIDGSGSAVGNAVPAVPEPSTWALMLVGFFGIGAAVRRPRERLRLAQIA